MAGTPPAPQTAGYDLSPTDAAEYVGVHPQTIKRWVREGKVAAFRTPGGWYRFRREDLDALVGSAA